MQDIVQATKYRDLVVLLLVLDEAEIRARKLAKQFPELGAIAASVSQAADLCRRLLRGFSRSVKFRGGSYL